MPKFFPLYLRRSDGKLEIITHHKRKEKNEPTPDQLDRSPDANGISDFYREVGIDEQKHLDWRRKLGTLLARDLGHTDVDKGYILAAFPENYRLFEHVKKAEGDKAGVKNVKTHAGGGNERQDAYLYGHPLGRKKRYRSPGDFYAHLYWLATDESGDPDNCTCKICCPEEIDEPKAAPVQVKKEALPEVSKQSTKDVTQEKPVAKRESQTPAPPKPHPAAPTPRSVPQPRNHDQAADLTFNSYVFRQGELVWFNRGGAWGLGIVVRRWRHGQNSGEMAAKAYSIQPLSHPFNHPGQALVTGDASLRPWLAWSVPNFTCEGLNKINPTYETVDWNAFFQHKYGSGDLEVDGSILAAKAIDPTYTTFDMVAREEPQPGVYEIHWNGVYLGAEKIWIGDILRLRTAANNEILVVHEILERSRISAFNQQVLESSIQIVGDVYATHIQNQSNLNDLLPGIDTKILPSRLVQDLRERNRRTIQTKRQATTLRLVRASAAYTTRDIKGRWYEASLMHPILNPDGWEAEFSRGEISEIGYRMNSRLDCNNPPAMRANLPASAESRRQQRYDAYGKAVPADLRIYDEVTDPARQVTQTHPQATSGMAIDPSFRSSSRQDQHRPDQSLSGQGGHSNTMDVHSHYPLPTSEHNTGGLDEFMNLDDVDGTGMVGFGQDYGNGQGY